MLVTFACRYRRFLEIPSPQQSPAVPRYHQGRQVPHVFRFRVFFSKSIRVTSPSPPAKPATSDDASPLSRALSSSSPKADALAPPSPHFIHNIYIILFVLSSRVRI